jgi:hypothetical protein
MGTVQEKRVLHRKGGSSQRELATDKSNLMGKQLFNNIMRRRAIKGGGQGILSAVLLEDSQSEV